MTCTMPSPRSPPPAASRCSCSSATRKVCAGSQPRWRANDPRAPPSGSPGMARPGISRLALMTMLRCALALCLVLGLAAPSVAASRDAATIPPDLPDIVAPLIPAVVNISILKQRPKPDGRLSQGAQEMEKPIEEYGSGFVIDPAGY